MNAFSGAGASPTLTQRVRLHQNWIILSISAILGFGIGSTTRADVIFSFSGGNAITGTGFTYGFQFTPVVNVTVDSLGYYDAGQDGLATGHQVGIWNTSGSLLASSTVTTANSTLGGPVVNGGQYRFTAVPALNLLAGTTYVFGAESGNPSADIWYFGGTNISNSPTLVTVSPIGYFANGEFVFPNQTISNTYAAGSFTAFATVPEPSTLALLGAGVLALASYAWPRRRI